MLETGRTGSNSLTLEVSYSIQVDVLISQGLFSSFKTPKGKRLIILGSEFYSRQLSLLLSEGQGLSFLKTIAKSTSQRIFVKNVQGLW